MLKPTGSLKDFANTKSVMLEVSAGYYIMQGVGSWLQAVGFTQKDGPDRFLCVAVVTALVRNMSAVTLACC